MAASLAKTIASCKKDQAKFVHELELLRIHLHLIRQEHQALLNEPGHEHDPVHQSGLRHTEQVVFPRLHQNIQMYETMIERMKARTMQLEKVLEWEIGEDKELEPMHEPVWFV